MYIKLQEFYVEYILIKVSFTCYMNMQFVFLFSIWNHSRKSHQWWKFLFFTGFPGFSYFSIDMKIKKYSHVFICYFIVSNDTVVPVICGVCVVEWFVPVIQCMWFLCCRTIYVFGALRPGSFWNNGQRSKFKNFSCWKPGRFKIKGKTFFMKLLKLNCKFRVCSFLQMECQFTLKCMTILKHSVSNYILILYLGCRREHTCI